MKIYNRITPEGTKDVLFEECKARRETEKRLSDVFVRRGYHEVLTPGIEFYDLFQLPEASISQEALYKTTDNQGRLLVFRPDSTLPIARMTASRLHQVKTPIRLFYNQSVYQNRPDLSGQNTELPQMGIELLGASGLRADLEVISVAVQALSSCAKSFRIEIGHAKLFHYFAQKLKVSDEIKENIRSQIESKNYGMLQEILSQLEPGKEVTALQKLPTWFGGEEILSEAEKYCEDETAQSMLQEVKTLYNALKDFGLKDQVIVDLGLVQRNLYYTGIVFSAYVEEFGKAVLTGGRYDNLLEKFGFPMPAVGFCIDTSVLSEILLQRENALLQEPEIILVHSEPGFEIKGQKIVDSYWRQGLYCESSIYEKLEESLAYAKQIKAVKFIVAGETITEQNLRERTS